MIFTFLILAAVVTSMSIENGSANLPLNRSRVDGDVSIGSNRSQVLSSELFYRTPLEGKGPDGCDFSDVVFTSEYHLKLMETHPQFIACQSKQGDVDFRFATRPLESAEGDLEVAASPIESEATEIHEPLKRRSSEMSPSENSALAELIKEYKNLKSRLAAVSNGEIVPLERYQPIRGQFMILISKLKLLDTQKVRVVRFRRELEMLSNTFDEYTELAKEMCVKGQDFACIDFNQGKFDQELVNVRKESEKLQNDINTNRDKSEEHLQTFRIRYDDFVLITSKLNTVDTRQWGEWYHLYYVKVLYQLSETMSNLRFSLVRLGVSN